MPSLEQTSKEAAVSRVSAKQCTDYRSGTSYLQGWVNFFGKVETLGFQFNIRTSKNQSKTHSITFNDFKVMGLIEENGNRIFSRDISGPSSSWIDYRYGALYRGTANFSGALPDNRSALKFTFNPSSLSDKGHLDYLEIYYKKNIGG